APTRAPVSVCREDCRAVPARVLRPISPSAKKKRRPLQNPEQNSLDRSPINYDTFINQKLKPTSLDSTTDARRRLSTNADRLTFRTPKSKKKGGKHRKPAGALTENW